MENVDSLRYLCHSIRKSNIRQLESQKKSRKISNGQNIPNLVKNRNVQI